MPAHTNQWRGAVEERGETTLGDLMNEAEQEEKHFTDMECERGEGVQGALTLFCSGAAQVCHDDRVVELKEQLEVEEEDGDRQEEKVEVERVKRVKEGAPCG